MAQTAIHILPSDRVSALTMPPERITGLVLDGLVDESVACCILGGSASPISRSTLWRGVRAGRYPRPLKIAVNTNRWRTNELVAVVEQAAAARDGKAI